MQLECIGTQTKQNQNRLILLLFYNQLLKKFGLGQKERLAKMLK